MAPRLSDAARGALHNRTGSDRELIPFSETERQDIEAQVESSLEAGPIDFSNTRFEAPFFVQGFVFPSVSFENAVFREAAEFESAIFSEAAYFLGATFNRVASFRGAIFSEAAYFMHATFSSGAIFDSATFSSGDASFERAAFRSGASFLGATFIRVYFRNATFDSRFTLFQGATFIIAVFEGATFSHNVSFQDATFNSAYFRGAIFGGSALFDRAIFSNAALFDRATFSGSADFVNAEMKGPTTFDDVRFSEPPRCFNAKLHEGTTWHGVAWPETPKNVTRARRFIDAYERLKLEMDKLKKHEDELKFFALEQQCRGVVHGFWNGRLPNAIYWCVGDYGRSYVRPLGLIVAVWLVGAFFMALHLVGFWAPIPGRAFLLSFANTFSVLGIRREFIDQTTVQSFPPWLTVVAMSQSIFGIVLLFFFGLGIRNRFRIK
jgi:uncharacterized protein YjbI with pentapeptide repeats